LKSRSAAALCVLSFANEMQQAQAQSSQRQSRSVG
jgi:hypothetical protein